MKVAVSLSILILLGSCATRRKNMTTVNHQSDSVVTTHTIHEAQITDSTQSEQLVIIDSVTTAAGVKVYGVKLRQRTRQVTHETETSCKDSVAIVSETGGREDVEEHPMGTGSTMPNGLIIICLLLLAGAVYHKFISPLF